MQTNQYGTVPASAPTAWMRNALTIGYRSDSVSRRSRIDWGAGLEGIGQVGASSGVLLSEGYIKARLGVVEFFAGRRKQVFGLAQSPLSSGSFSWSRNALPMPRVQLSTVGYVPVPFTRGFVAVDAFFAHGWFGNQTYVQGAYLHQKALSVRLGKPTARFRVYGSFNHQVQWAGYAPFLEADPTASFGGQIANSLEAYYNVVVATKSDALKNLAKFTTYDQNRVGDHRGSAEAALELNLNRWTVLAYQQHFYDIGRKLLNGTNIEDGLYGVRLRNKRPNRLIDDLVLEVFNSQSQGYTHFGKVLGGEAENYFLNGQYPDGWSYRGRTIGTPFITQTADTNPALGGVGFSGYRADGSRIDGVYGINNNRVLAFSWGLSGSLRAAQRVRSSQRAPMPWRYQLKMSYSQNHGIYSRPFPEGINQFSAMASLVGPTRWLGGTSVVMTVGYDEGQLLRYPSQVGFYVGIRKEWVRRLRAATANVVQHSHRVAHQKG